jgi:hypothetical protein
VRHRRAEAVERGGNHAIKAGEVLEKKAMDTNILLLIVIVLLSLGGGYYGR